MRGSKFGKQAEYLRAEALRLRLQDKKPVREIAQIISVPEATVWKWLRGHALPKVERWNTKLKDLTDMRFGKLIALRRAPNRTTSGGYSQVCWWVQCDCGSPEKSVIAARLTQNNTTSCGCNQSKKKYATEDAIKMYILRNYQSSAKQRGLEWKLTKEEFFTLTQQNCSYCGVEPFTTIIKPRYGTLSYNGIDRVDNDKGYFPSNVVPCCKPCNYAKKNITQEEFLRWINRLRNLSSISAGAR